MAVAIIMPRLGDFMTEGVVARWAKAAGEAVQQGEVVAEIESEKLNYDLEAAQAGFFHPMVTEGATVDVDGLLGYLLAEGEEPPQAPEAATPPAGLPARAAPTPTPRAARASGDPVPSTPGARRLAASLGVDISLVTPTGPRGRVVDADVRAYAEAQDPAAASGPAAPLGLPEPSQVVPMKGMRRAIADHMRGSMASTAQLSYFLEVDVTEAQRLRRDRSKEQDQTLTLAHVLIKACAETLKRYPAHNTVLHEGNILYFDEINIGVAVALDEGLIVPVLRNVGSKSIHEISGETHELAEKAREGRLTPDDTLGGTFTISVLGTVDGFTPILSRGQSAILGAGRSAQKAVVRGGEVVVREMTTLSLTADHQVIDGAVAASFLRRLQQMVERPGALFE